MGSSSWGLALTGACGSGKTTTAQLLATFLHWRRVSAGDIARSIDADTAATGAMADPEALDAALLPELSPGPVILDGYPRTRRQTRTLRKIGDFQIVMLGIDWQEARRRLLARGRPDDTESAIDGRIAEQWGPMRTVLPDLYLHVGRGMTPLEVVMLVLSSHCLNMQTEEERMAEAAI